jgi:hypothetical protein
VPTSSGGLTRGASDHRRLRISRPTVAPRFGDRLIGLLRCEFGVELRLPLGDHFVERGDAVDHAGRQRVLRHETPALSEIGEHLLERHAHVGGDVAVNMS